MMKKILVGSLLVTSTFMTACTTTSVPHSEPKVNAAVSITDRTWIVTHIQGEPITTKPTDNNIPSLLLNSNEQRVSGADGCNRMMGGYVLKGENLSFTQMATTMMACMDDNINKIAQRYSAALAQTHSYQATPSTLILKDKDGKTLVQFSTAVQPR